MPTANLENIRLHYEASGEGDSLLFIHGLGSSNRDWENQVASEPLIFLLALITSATTPYGRRR